METIIIPVITVIAAVVSLKIADRPIFEKIRNPAKTAKIWALSAVLSVIIVGVVMPYWLAWGVIVPSLGFSWVPQLTGNPWATVVYYLLLGFFAVGAVLGLVVVLVARRRKPKRRILQCLTIAYSVIVVIMSVFAVVLRFVW